MQKQFLVVYPKWSESDEDFLNRIYFQEKYKDYKIFQYVFNQAPLTGEQKFIILKLI